MITCIEFCAPNHQQQHLSKAPFFYIGSILSYLLTSSLQEVGCICLKEVEWQQQHGPWFNAPSWCYEKWLPHLESTILSMTQKSWEWSKASWQGKLKLCTPLYHLSQWLDLIHICFILNLLPVRPICSCRFACVFLRGHFTLGRRGKQFCII